MCVCVCVYIHTYIHTYIYAYIRFSSVRNFTKWYQPHALVLVVVPTSRVITKRITAYTPTLALAIRSHSVGVSQQR